MKPTRYIPILAAAAAAAVLLSSCVKDTLYDTPHPDYGKIAVTAGHPCPRPSVCSGQLHPCGVEPG